jgi:hypothetical protein
VEGENQAVGDQFRTNSRRVQPNDGISDAWNLLRVCRRGEFNHQQHGSHGCESYGTEYSNQRLNQRSAGLRDVLPGRYTILGIGNGWDLEWANPAFLRPRLAHAVNGEEEIRPNMTYKVIVNVE